MSNEFEEMDENDEERFDELHREKIENLRPLMDSVIEALEGMGLYALNLGMGSSVQDVETLENQTAKEIVESGAGQFVIMGQFRIGDVAFTDRVLDPDGYAMRTDISSITGPDMNKTSVEDAVERLKDKFKKGPKDE